MDENFYNKIIETIGSEYDIGYENIIFYNPISNFLISEINYDENEEFITFVKFYLKYFLFLKKFQKFIMRITKLGHFQHPRDLREISLYQIKIYINNKCDINAQIMILLHELRHYWQYKNGLIPKKLYSRTDIEKYNAQEHERDANDFSKKYTKEIIKYINLPNKE